MSSTASSVVLGFAARLPPSYFEPFVRSLRATGYRGRVGLALGHYSEDDIAAFDALADFTVVVDDAYKALPPAAVGALRTLRNTRRVRRLYPLAFSLAAASTREKRALDRRDALEFELEGLQALRYAHYYDILQGAASDADQILLTDVRDVLFQADPFEPSVNELEVFLEDSAVTIGAEPHNWRWMVNLYGEPRASAWRDAIVSCSGTVIGPRVQILHYLREMSLAVAWRRRPLGSHDQGVHNYLLRSGRLGSPRIISNGDGRVLTMGAMQRCDRDDDGFVVTRDGSRPAVLHQYDRHPGLAEDLIARLRTPE